MRTFDFTIIASGIDPNEENFEDRFFEAGCGDATISFQKGALTLEFSREAKNFSQALFSAIRAAITAGAKVEHIEPDHLVNLSDIAERAGLSRAAASLYAKGDRRQNFPPPVARVTTDSPLWDWVPVARWLFRERKAIKRRMVIEAKVVRGANLAIQRAEGFERSVFSKKLMQFAERAGSNRAAA
ncbi:MAG: hypothetical protein M3N38_08515 [Pseudomonadota bacterium]|nr:hypothetical protein [Pseudomonadota bacterium]